MNDNVYSYYYDGGKQKQSTLIDWVKDIATVAILILTSSAFMIFLNSL